MQKYWQAWLVGMQNHLTYRVNFLARTLFGFIPLLAMLQLWRTIYAGKGEGAATIAEFTLSQMISYYLIVRIVDTLSAVAEDDWQIAADIKDGVISQFLLKPIDYLWYRLCIFGAGRITFVSVAALPLGLFILCFRGYFVLPADLATFALFLLSVGLTALLQFFMSFAMAMLAFWVLEVSTFIFIFYAFEYLASGQLFPLDVLPAPLLKFLFYTPFPYQLYFPVSIYLGKVQGAGVWTGLAAQGFWVVAAYGVARLMWARGIRRYAAVGG